MNSEEMNHGICESGKDYLNMLDQAKMSKLERIIHEYEEQNNIESITEEELLDLISESALNPNFYLPSSGRYSDSGIIISDYELHLLLNGFNLFEEEDSEYLEELQQTEDGIDLGDVEQLSESDQLNDLKDEYYDDLIDKYYGTSLRIDNEYTNSDEVFSDC